MNKIDRPQYKKLVDTIKNDSQTGDLPPQLINDLLSTDLSKFNFNRSTGDAQLSDFSALEHWALDREIVNYYYRMDYISNKQRARLFVLVRENCRSIIGDVPEIVGDPIKKRKNIKVIKSKDITSGDGDVVLLAIGGVLCLGLGTLYLLTLLAGSVGGGGYSGESLESYIEKQQNLPGLGISAGEYERRYQACINWSAC